MMSWRELRALLGGYFWLPCPLCGEMFGGNEWDLGSFSTIPTPGEPWDGRGVCPKCAAAARRVASWGRTYDPFEYRSVGA